MKKRSKEVSKMWIWIILVAMIWSALAWSQEEVPAERQALILLRALAYDRNLSKRTKGALTIGVIYQEEDRESKAQMGEIYRAFEKFKDMKVQGMSLEVLSMSFEKGEGLEKWIREKGVEVIYVTRGLEWALEEILAISAHEQVSTLGDSMHYVERGVAIGIVLKGSRPELVVNLYGTKAEGMDLSSDLLKLAKIVSSSR